MKYILFFCILLISCRIVAQNLVPNESFEDNDILHLSSPTSFNQIEDMKHWKNFESSDWYSDDPGKLNGKFSPFQWNGSGTGNPLNAHSGDKYIGFGSCEGAQVKLTQKTDKLKWIKLSFWFSPRGKCNTTINSYLTVDENQSSSLGGHCLDPDIDFEVNFKTTVNADGVNAIHTPGNWYYSEQIILAGDDRYEWLAIKGDNDFGAFDDHRYVYIDDISVSQIAFCDIDCANMHIGAQVPTIHPSPIPQDITGNTQFNFFFTAKNANSVLFRIWDAYSHVMYESNNYDASGLRDPGYDDFAVIWNGNTNFGNDLPGGVYPYTIDITSCYSSDITIGGSIHLSGILNAPAIPYPATKNREIPDCCPDHLYIQNQSIGGTRDFSADNFIKVGSSVNPNTFIQPGDVTFYSGSNIVFRAPNDIKIDPGVIIQVGAEYKTILQPCQYSASREARKPERLYWENIRNGEATEINSTQNNGALFEVFPNPNSGEFTVHYANSKAQTYTLEITNAIGEIIYSKVTRERAVSVDLSSQPGGIYIVRIQNEYDFQVKKVVVK